MNRPRVIGLLAIAILAALWTLRSCAPEPQQPPPPPTPPRESFDASKPLRVEVISQSSATERDTSWLERELRFVLARGNLMLAPTLEPALTASMHRSRGSASTSSTPPFTLRLTLGAEPSSAQLALIAPDDVTERTADLQVALDSKLGTMQLLARRLAQFLGAAAVDEDWAALLDTQDEVAYEGFIAAREVIFGPQATGFTSPPEPVPDAVANLERLETLSRRYRTFSRARALLSLAYLSLGGEDRASLTKLAETAAQRALGMDPQLADAHAALGIVRWQRLDWAKAQEHFDTALAHDTASLPALEGLACLLTDAGRTHEALPVAMLMSSLQPGNLGARECATYAAFANDMPGPAYEREPFDVARIRAAMLLLAQDRSAAEALLLDSQAGESRDLIRSIVAASQSKPLVPEALRAITRAAGDRDIDAETAALYGAALRQPDFVFNRLLRLTKQSEPAPWRLLWLPQTQFLRQHPRFREVIDSASLTAYWQGSTPPDICTGEPKVYGCALKSAHR